MSFSRLLFLIVLLAVGFFLWKVGSFLTREPEEVAQVEQENATNSSAGASGNPVAAEGTAVEKLPLASDKPIQSNGRAEGRAQVVDMSSENVKLAHAFMNAELGYWKNALDSDRPNKAKKPLTFICLMPTRDGGKEFYELNTAPGKKMEVRRLSADDVWAEMPLATFNRAMAEHPCVMKIDNRAYFCSPTKKKEQQLLAPKKGETFRCGQADLGELYLRGAKGALGKPRFAYEVSCRPAATKTVIPVGTFDLGTDLAREDFVKAAA